MKDIWIPHVLAWSLPTLLSPHLSLSFCLVCPATLCCPWNTPSTLLPVKDFSLPAMSSPLICKCVFLPDSWQWGLPLCRGVPSLVIPIPLLCFIFLHSTYHMTYYIFTCFFFFNFLYPVPRILSSVNQRLLFSTIILSVSRIVAGIQ